MWTLLRIALRNVLRNRRRTLITLAALVVGVGVMVSIRGLLNGFQRANVVGIVEGQTGALQVHRTGYAKNMLSNPLTLDFALDAALLGRVRAVEGVTAVTARIQFAGMISEGDQTRFFAATALDPQAEFEVCPQRRRTIDGTFGTAADGVVLTSELARAAGLSLGGEGALLAPDRDGALNGESVRLESTMRLGFPGEKKVGLVPLALAQRLLRMEGRATELVLAVARIEDADTVAAALQKALGPAFEVTTWKDQANFVEQTQRRQNFILQLIASVFLVLMLLGVANTMLMSVFERTREIGTLMAVGVRRSRIVLLFQLEALGIGVLGALLGAAAGWGLVLWLGATGLEFQSPGQAIPFTIRPFVTPSYVAGVVVLAALGAGVFALYPAVRAARLRPVEALAGR